MKPHHIKSVVVFSLLCLLPVSVSAEGGLEGLEVLDQIVQTYSILLGVGIAGVICAIIYLFRPDNWGFFLSSLAIVVLLAFFIYSFFLFPPDLRMAPELMNPLRNRIFMLLTGIVTLVAIRKFINDPASLSWYYTLNTSSVLLTSQLLDFFKIQSPLAIFLQAFFYLLYSHLYARKVSKEALAGTKKTILRAGFIASLCFLTIHLVSMVSLFYSFPEAFNHRELVFMTVTIVPVGILVTVALASLSAFISIKKHSVALNKNS